MSNRSLTLIIIPGVLVCSALLIIPLLLLFVDTIPEIDSPFSLYQDFLNKTFHQKILFRTIKVALITTIISSSWTSQVHFSLPSKEKDLRAYLSSLQFSLYS